ncbi:MAG: sensor histidine kinase, partial [Eubacteriales bacterium]
MLILVFYSIPESIILITLSSSLYGYDVKANLKRIFLLSTCLAITTYVTRDLPLKFPQNMFVQIPIFVLLTSYFLKVSLKRSFIIILTGFIIISLTESTLNPLAVAITGEGLNLIYENIWSRLALGWCYLLLLSILTAIVVKKQISFTSAIQFFKTTNFNSKVSFLIFVVLIQAFLAGTLQLTSELGESSVWPIVFNGVILRRVIGFALITIPIVSIFLLKRLFTLSQQEAITASQEAYIATVNDLFLAIKGQKHDFINHIQVITGLLQLGKNEEALKYGLQLGQESRETGEVLNIKDPTIAALIKSKISTCIVKQIRFKTNINAETANLAVKPYDLVRILGNLLDNAIYAVSE